MFASMLFSRDNYGADARLKMLSIAIPANAKLLDAATAGTPYFTESP
jgi:hypothetical protein